MMSCIWWCFYDTGSILLIFPFPLFQVLLLYVSQDIPLSPFTTPLSYVLIGTSIMNILLNSLWKVWPLYPCDSLPLCLSWAFIWAYNIQPTNRSLCLYSILTLGLAGSSLVIAVGDIYSSNNSLACLRQECNWCYDSLANLASLFYVWSIGWWFGECICVCGWICVHGWTYSVTYMHIVHYFHCFSFQQ